MAQIEKWLDSIGLGRYAPLFAEHDIDFQVLPELSETDLEKLGISLGHRKKLLRAMADLAVEECAGSPAVPERSAAERRQLTVLFCDLVGSTELAGRLDPEDMRAVIAAYQSACSDVIQRYEGHVAKFMGDGVLAYFGYPQAHEDDAERAVRAGLDLTRAVGGLPAEDGGALAVRIGIATGPVVVGDLVGEGATQEAAVIGATPNLAARLQALAAPATVVISRATRRLVGGLFELADLGPLRIKGFAEPLAAWRVEGEGRAEGRFEALHGQRLTPLVGREHEIAMLLERWAWARDGDGHVVLLSGEAGIGKSRVIRALRDRLADEAYTPLSHYCSPYHTNSAFFPVIGLLERAARLDRDAPPEDQLGRLEALLAGSSERPEQEVPLLAALLGVPTGARYPPLALAPELQKRRTLQVLVDQLVGLAARQPVLALYEDLHWSDPSTLELLELVIERIRQLPVLVLITFRPEFRAPWTSRAHVTTLTMSRLGRRQGADLVARVVGGKPLPPEVIEQVVARTDGIPLFVEELTKTVLESGLLVDAGDRYELHGPLPPLAIPMTLHDSLMARLDRLSPVKEVAQIGAVIGRDFSHEVLAAMTERTDAELRIALDRLVDAELIFRRGSSAGAIYSFKHALVQDAAYQSLLKSKRQELHGRIARCLEQDFPEVVAAEPDVLAHHYGAAGDPGKAFEHRFEAGRRAADRYANLEAIEHLMRARADLAALPDGPERIRSELDVLVTLGPAAMVVKGFAADEVEEIYQRVRELCRTIGATAQSRAATQALRVARMVRGDLTAAAELGEELLTLGERDGSLTDRFEGHLALGVVDDFGGRLASARSHLERALELYDPAGLDSLARHPIGNPVVVCLGHLATVLLLNGYPEQAAKRSREALEAARASSHPYSLAQALASRGVAAFCGRPVGDPGDAAALVTLAEEQGFGFWHVFGMAFRGVEHALNGRTEAALADLHAARAAARCTGAALVSAAAIPMLAVTLGRIGEVQEALALLAQQRSLAARTGIRFQDPLVRLLEGELRLQLRKRELAVVEACFRDAMAIARRQHSRNLELRAATSLARLLIGQRRPAEARDLLAPIYGWFTEGFDTVDLKDAKALLDELT